MALSENKTVFFNIASTAIVAAINFFTIPVFTRMLGTDGYGIVAVYLAWTQIFTVFVGLKVDGSIGSAQANLREDEQDSYQFSVLVLAVITFCAVFSLVLLTLQPLAALLGMPEQLVIAMLFQSFGAFVVAFFNMRFVFRKQVQRNFALAVGLCLATTTLSTALILLVYKGADAYLGRVYGLAAPNIMLALALLAFFARQKEKRLDIKYWRFCLALTMPLVFHGLAQLVLSQVGKIAVQQVMGDSFAGVYGLSVTIVGLLTAIYVAFNNSFVPFMYDDLAGKTSETVKQGHFRNYFALYTLGSCAFALVAPDVLRVMSPQDFWAGADLIPLLVVGQYCVFLYSFPVNYEFYKMRTLSIAIGTTLAAVVNVVLVVALVPQIGMWGAAIATTISCFALFVFHFCIARFRLGDRNYPAFFFFVGLALVMLFAVLGTALMGNPVARWVVGVALAVLAGIRVWQRRSIF